MLDPEPTIGATLPEDARKPIGMINPGIDAAGQNVFFGFNFDDGSRACLTAFHEGLGQIINYLQRISTIAQQRRLAAVPADAELEIKAKSHNPVQQLGIDLEVSGQFALWQCTMRDGTLQEVQIPLDLMEALVVELPPRIEEMKRRQGARRH